MKPTQTILARAILAIIFVLAFSLPPSMSNSALAASNCNVEGLKKGTNDRLRKNLCKMSVELGAVKVTSSCRTRKANRSVKKSYHLYHRGCKAADIVIAGVGKQKILNWWAKNVGGGRGYYCGRRFVHVDVGPDRTWRWYCS